MRKKREHRLERDELGMIVKSVHDRHGLCVPYFDRLVIRTGSNESIVGRKTSRTNPMRMAFERKDEFLL